MSNLWDVIWMKLGNWKWLHSTLYSRGSFHHFVSQWRSYYVQSNWPCFSYEYWKVWFLQSLMKCAIFFCSLFLIWNFERSTGYKALRCIGWETLVSFIVVKRNWGMTSLKFKTWAIAFNCLQSWVISAHYLEHAWWTDRWQMLTCNVTEKYRSFTWNPTTHYFFVFLSFCFYFCQGKTNLLMLKDFMKYLEMLQ